MDLILSVLLLLVGGLTGALLVLLWDNHYLGRRWRAMLRRQRQLREARQAAERELAVAQTQMRTFGQRLRAVSAHVEALTTQRWEIQQKLARAEAELTVQTEVRAEAETERNALRRENQRVCHDLAQAEARLTAQETKAEAEAARLEAARDALQMQLETAVADRDRVQEHLDQVLGQVKRAQGIYEQLQQTHTELEAARQTIAELRHQVENRPYGGRNSLQQIHGIGPAYARRLREAGIDSLDDLAQRDPVQVAELARLRAWKAGEAASWVEQAQEIIGDGA